MSEALNQIANRQSKAAKPVRSPLKNVMRNKGASKQPGPGVETWTSLGNLDVVARYFVPSDFPISFCDVLSVATQLAFQMAANTSFGSHCTHSKDAFPLIFKV